MKLLTLAGLALTGLATLAKAFPVNDSQDVAPTVSDLYGNTLLLPSSSCTPNLKRCATDGVTLLVCNKDKVWEIVKTCPACCLYGNHGYADCYTESCPNPPLAIEHISVREDLVNDGNTATSHGHCIIGCQEKGCKCRKIPNTSLWHCDCSSAVADANSEDYAVASPIEARKGLSDPLPIPCQNHGDHACGALDRTGESVVLFCPANFVWRVDTNCQNQNQHCCYGSVPGSAFCSSHPCKEQHWHSGSDSSSPQAIPLINIHERDNVEIGDAYNINCGVLCLRISSSDKQHCDCSLAVAATETHTAHKRVLASDFTDYNESEFSCSHSARKCSADGKLILKCVVDHWVKLGSCPGGCYEPAPNFPTCNKPSTTEQRDDTPIGEDQARCKVRQTRCSPRRRNIVEKCFHGQWRPSKDCKKGHCVQEETRDATCVYTGGLESTFSTDTNCQRDQPCIQELDKDLYQEESDPLKVEDTDNPSHQDLETRIHEHHEPQQIQQNEQDFGPCYLPGSMTCRNHRKTVVVCNSNRNFEKLKDCPGSCCEYGRKPGQAFCACGQLPRSSQDLEVRDSGEPENQLESAERRCTPGAFWCERVAVKDGRSLSAIFTCGSTGKRKLSALCGNKGCCSEGPNDTAFCTCSASTSEHLDSRSNVPSNQEVSLALRDSVNLVDSPLVPAAGQSSATISSKLLVPRTVQSPGPCKNPGEYGCAYITELHRSGVFVCGPQHQWLLSAVCGGGPESCRVGPNWGTAYCLSSPSAKAESDIHLPDLPSSIGTLNNREVSLSCDKPGTYACGLQTNSDHDYVFVCNSSFQWQTSADCGNNCCIYGSIPGTAYCSDKTAPCPRAMVDSSDMNTSVSENHGYPSTAIPGHSASASMSKSETFPLPADVLVKRSCPRAAWCASRTNPKNGQRIDALYFCGLDNLPHWNADCGGKGCCKEANHGIAFCMCGKPAPKEEGQSPSTLITTTIPRTSGLP